MAIKIPEKKQIEYNETLVVGVARIGYKLHAYLEGKIDDTEVSVQSEQRDYYDAAPKIFTKQLNNQLLKNYNIILPLNELKSKLKEVFKEFEQTLLI